jgi:hypothetical protein
MDKEQVLGEKTILDALRNLGVGHVYAEYSGSGDSGDMEFVEYSRAVIIPNESSDLQSLRPGMIDGPAKNVTEDRVAGVTVEYNRKSNQYDYEQKEYREVIEKITEPLTDAVSGMLWDVLDRNHGGWENNDGGHGYFLLDVIRGKLYHEHGDYYTERIQTDHVFKLDASGYLDEIKEEEEKKEETKTEAV